jgi:hypothetical protein
MKKYLNNYNHFVNSCRKYAGDIPELIFSDNQIMKIKSDFLMQDFQIKTGQVSHPYLSLDEIFLIYNKKSNTEWQPIK